MSTITANKTLAEQFPLTARQIADELRNARDRVEILERVEQEFDEANNLIPQFEVIVPPTHPKHRPAKHIGSDLGQCVRATRTKANREGASAYAFVNLNHNISVALAEGDMMDIVGAGIIHQQNEESAKRFRAIWTRNDRGSIWLL